MGLTLRQRDQQIDLQRLGLLVLAAVNLSAQSYVLIRFSKSKGQYRVNVRFDQEEQASSATHAGGGLLFALDQSVAWLRQKARGTA